MRVFLSRFLIRRFFSIVFAYFSSLFIVVLQEKNANSEATDTYSHTVAYRTGLVVHHMLVWFLTHTRVFFFSPDLFLLELFRCISFLWHVNSNYRKKGDLFFLYNFLFFFSFSLFAVQKRIVSLAFFFFGSFMFVFFFGFGFRRRWRLFVFFFLVLCLSFEVCCGSFFFFCFFFFFSSFSYTFSCRCFTNWLKSAIEK